jgi:hypothetical protein
VAEGVASVLDAVVEDIRDEDTGREEMDEERIESDEEAEEAEDTKDEVAEIVCEAILVAETVGAELETSKDVDEFSGVEDEMGSAFVDTEATVGETDVCELAGTVELSDTSVVAVA